jgi:tRNA(Leu) C34 or U34 (ribose-2'-O)-methylase TrmL
VVRCADAAGADGVVLTGSSVDPYNPKVVRASVGSLFHIGLAIETDAVALTSAVRGAGLTILAADAVGDLDLDQAADAGLLEAPTAGLFGNEAWGLPAPIRALADRVVNVPIHGRAESLNLATAAAVCLYASARAHRVAPRPDSVLTAERGGRVMASPRRPSSTTCPTGWSSRTRTGAWSRVNSMALHSWAPARGVHRRLAGDRHRARRPRGQRVVRLHASPTTASRCATG